MDVCAACTPNEGVGSEPGLGMLSGRRFFVLFAEPACGRLPGKPAQRMDISRRDNCAIARCDSTEFTLMQWFLLLDEVDRLDSGTVIDTRQVTGHLTEIEFYLLALHAMELVQLRRHRIAVVLSDEPQAELDFFVFTAKNLGLQIKAFESTETAITWAGSRHEQTV